MSDNFCSGAKTVRYHLTLTNAYCLTAITFAGFKLSPDGYHVDSLITDVISCFPVPYSRYDLRTFLAS